MGEPTPRWISLTGWAGRYGLQRSPGKIRDIASRIGVGLTKAKGAGWFASKPGIYIFIILCAMSAAYAYKLRTDGIFACRASGYTSDRYIGYCQAGGYADYEHGALFFKLEPSAVTSARNADVVFLGNSYFQYAFSTDATSQWFASASARYYLLGFLYGEKVPFLEPLLREIKPKAKVYVLPVESLPRFETVPAREVLHDPAAAFNYRIKRGWQLVHKAVCGRLPVVCGKTYTVFRSRETGSYYLDGVPPWMSKKTTVVYRHDTNTNPKVIALFTNSARQFLAGMSVDRDCIILTRDHGTSIETASAIASAAGLTLVAPELDGLQTFDGWHLDPPSAERWSKAFFEVAGPQIRRCLSFPAGSR